MTQPSYKRWTVSSYPRPAMDVDANGVPFRTGVTELVTVVEDGPYRYEVTLSPDGSELASLSIEGGPIDQKLMRAIPLGYLTEVARGQAANVGQMVEGEGYSVQLATELARTEPGSIRRKGDPPALEEFAQAWKSIPGSALVGGVRVTRRKALADRFGAAESTIDKWTRAARDAGLIPKATTGRSRQTSSTDQNGEGR